MRHSTEKPPNWDILEATFPGIDWDKGLIVTYGKTYHSKQPITPDLIAHEEIHMRQQLDMGIEKWWLRYYADNEFRLSQEVEAYRNQVKHLREHAQSMNRNERRARIRFMAESLAGPTYGYILPYDKALSLISQ